GGIRPGAEPVSRCRGASEEPCGATTGPRLKNASGPLHWASCSAFQAKPERWNGIRTRDSMITDHVLYHLSYPRVWLTIQESNLHLRVSPALSVSYWPILRFAEHGHASRTAPVRFTSLNTRRPEGARASNGKARRKNGRAR